MQLKTILNRVQECPGFVYREAKLLEGSAASLNGLAQVTAPIGERLRQSLEALAAQMSSGEIANFSRLLNTLTGALNQASAAASRAMEMERLLMGEPTAIVGVAHLQNVTMEEAERRIRAATKALDRAKARGITLAVVPDPSSGGSGHEDEGGGDLH